MNCIDRTGNSAFLRILREIRSFLFLRAEVAKSAEIYTFLCFTLVLEGRKLRYDKSALRVLSTPSPPVGYSRLSQGES